MEPRDDAGIEPAAGPGNGPSPSGSLDELAPPVDPLEHARALAEDVPPVLTRERAVRSPLADAERSAERDRADGLEQRKRYEAFIASHHVRPWDGMPQIGTIVLAAAGSAILHIGREMYVAIEAESKVLEGLVEGVRFRLHGDGSFERDASGLDRNEPRGRSLGR